MKPIIVVATDEEYKLAQKRFKRHKIIKTGVGGINVVEKLKHLPKWLKIVNFGYVGSNNIPIGTEIEVSWCVHYHPKTEYKEKRYCLTKGSGILCLTSDEFVEEYNSDAPVIFDMELAYICALGFKNVQSIKIVSDNLSEKEYENNIKVDGKIVYQYLKEKENKYDRKSKPNVV